jgi:hypothetical protein
MANKNNSEVDWKEKDDYAKMVEIEASLQERIQKFQVRKKPKTVTLVNSFANLPTRQIDSPSSISLSSTNTTHIFGPSTGIWLKSQKQVNRIASLCGV